MFAQASWRCFIRRSCSVLTLSDTLLIDLLTGCVDSAFLRSCSDLTFSGTLPVNLFFDVTASFRLENVL